MAYNQPLSCGKLGSFQMFRLGLFCCGKTGDPLKLRRGKGISSEDGRGPLFSLLLSFSQLVCFPLVPFLCRLTLLCSVRVPAAPIPETPDFTLCDSSSQHCRHWPPQSPLHVPALLWVCSLKFLRWNLIIKCLSPQSPGDSTGDKSFCVHGKCNLRNQE